jgi:hypothetical protein
MEQGRVKTRLQDLLTVLRSRYGEVDAALETRILRIEDPQALEDLIARAAVASSLVQFHRELER